MAKGERLRKLMKKWQLLSKLGRMHSSTIAAASACDDSWSQQSEMNEKVPPGLQAVYVGKSRRRYLIRSSLVNHPLFCVLLDKSGDGGVLTVGCEVVLFEHLLWMLENAEPGLVSFDELVEFYAC